MLDSNKISEFSSSITSPTGAGLKIAASAISSFQQGYAMLGEEARNSLFGD